METHPQEILPLHGLWTALRSNHLPHVCICLRLHPYSPILSQCHVVLFLFLRELGPESFLSPGGSKGRSIGARLDRFLSQTPDADARGS